MMLNFAVCWVGVGLISDKQLVEIARLIGDRLKPLAVYVFGSVATGRVRPDSDLDLAVMSNLIISFDDREALKERILSKFGVSVDLLDFAQSPPPLQAEIMRNGRKIFVWDPTGLATILMTALGRYQKLNEERRPILEKRLGKDGWKRLF